MAEVTPSSNVLIMANADTYTPNSRKIKIKGVRLVGNAIDISTATITGGGKVIYSLRCGINGADESVIGSNIDANSLTAALTGTGSTLYVYLE